MRLPIASTWDGRPIEPAERAEVVVTRELASLRLAIDAPLHGDPPPAGPPGPTAALWEHEVVELFVAGPDERYLEIEVGPHGHHLVLWLEGVRRPVMERLPLALDVRRAGARWRAVATTDARVPLPEAPWRVNAYAIYGVGDARRWLAHAPVPGERPDFHRLDRFVPFVS